VLIGDQSDAEIDALLRAAGFDPDIDHVIRIRSVYRDSSGAIVREACPAQILRIG
jgi:hypothetical protein